MVLYLIFCISSEGITLQKTLFYKYFLTRFTFALCCKRMKAIQTIRITVYFDVIPLNNAGNFFTAI